LEVLFFLQRLFQKEQNLKSNHSKRNLLQRTKTVVVNKLKLLMSLKSQQEIKTTRRFNPRKNTRFNLQLKRNFLNIVMTRKPVLELNKNKKNGSVQVG
jgi:hypothetical protein